jgi:hypothetical protein
MDFKKFRLCFNKTLSACQLLLIHSRTEAGKSTFLPGNPLLYFGNVSPAVGWLNYSGIIDRESPLLCFSAL